MLLTIYAKELAIICAGFFIFNHSSHSLISPDSEMYYGMAMLSSSMEQIKKCYNRFVNQGVSITSMTILLE